MESLWNKDAGASFIVCLKLDRENRHKKLTRIRLATHHIVFTSNVEAIKRIL